jgi:uncharacterized membrane protein required for colicin V production
MQPIFYDIIIAAIVVITALRGRMRGFILTLCGFLTIFVAFIGALVVSEFLADPVAQLLFPAVERAILTVLEQGAAIAPDELPIAAVLESLHSVPFFAGLAEMCQTALDNRSYLFTGSAVFAVSLFFSRQLARIVLFALSFIAILIVWWLMSHALDLAFRLPILNFINRLGGLVLGFAQGIALCFILCWLLKDSYITPEAIDGSFLLPYFCGENPLANISVLNS